MFVLFSVFFFWLRSSNLLIRAKCKSVKKQGKYYRTVQLYLPKGNKIVIALFDS